METRSTGKSSEQRLFPRGRVVPYGQLMLDHYETGARPTVSPAPLVFSERNADRYNRIITDEDIATLQRHRAIPDLPAPVGAREFHALQVARINMAVNRDIFLTPIE